MRNAGITVLWAVTGCLLLALLQVGDAQAQKVLSGVETGYVLQAQADLERALSDPAMMQPERIALVERSAKTLKEYGQEPAFPIGDIPLKGLMESNYNQARKQFEDANLLKMHLTNKLLDQQLKIINTMQIEVLEDQIKIMLPGFPAPYELSLELASMFFKVDAAEGVSAGKFSDAASLVARFKRLAETKRLIAELDNLYAAQRMSMQNLHRDLNLITADQEVLRRRYKNAEMGTFTIKGYEGARLNYGMTPVAATTPEMKKLEATNQSINIINVVLEGLHLFNYSAENRYDGDKNRLDGGAFLMGFMLQGPNSFNGHYAKFSSFSNSGSASMGGQVHISNRWNAQTVMPGEQPSFDFTGTFTADGAINQGVLLRLTLKETAQRVQYEESEGEKVTLRANEERQLELLNVPLLNYPAELNQKNGTNYVYYAELEGPRVKDMVKLVKDSETIQYSDGKSHDSQILSLNWNSQPTTHKLKIYFGTYKPFVRDW